jgi:hypothetical protein
VAPEDIAATLEQAGLVIAEQGSVGLRSLHFVLATAPGRA